jgi:WD40 repeat protein
MRRPLNQPIVLKHQGDVLAVEFSADGKWILTAAGDGAPDCGLDTGLIGLPLRHSHSPRIHTGVSGWHCAEVEAWRIVVRATSDPRSRQSAARPARVIVGLSPDGGRVHRGRVGRLCQWWSPKTGQLVRSTLWNGGYLWSVALSDDGKLALVGGNGIKKGVKTAQLWSLEGGERLLFDLPHPDQVRAVAFSPDAKLAATACFDGNARLWSTDTGQPVGPPCSTRRSLKTRF